MKRNADLIPLHHRVYMILAQRISDGSFPAGRPVPSEDELAGRFDVSRVTIRKAMERLEREGRVSREQGRGTFPLQPAGESSTGEINAHILRNQMSLAERTTVQVLDYGLAAAQGDAAVRLGIAEGGEVLRIVRLRRDKRSPISHTTCYLQPDLAGIVQKRRLGRLPISLLLNQSGVALKDIFDRVTAILADPEIADLLDVDAGTPLVAMTRVAKTAEGRTVQWLRALYRPDRYEYNIDYSSDGGIPNVNSDSTPRILAGER